LVKFRNGNTVIFAILPGMSFIGTTVEEEYRLLSVAADMDDSVGVHGTWRRK